MGIIRRIIFITVLLGIAFVFYRFLNPQGADNLVARLRGKSIVSSIPNTPNTQDNISTGKIITGTIDTGTILTGTISTGKVFSGVINTGSIQTGLNKTGVKSSGETISIIDNMNGFSEVIDTSVSKKLIKGDINYKNSDYNFSMTFPGSWDGYTIENFTGKDIKAQFVFSLDKKDYFILYIISNSYYQINKTSQLNYLTYLSQDSTHTFAYKILEKSDTKSKAISYILKTFKLANSTDIPNIPTSIIPNAVKPALNTATTTKPSASNGNYIKNIFNSFVK